MDLNQKTVIFGGDHASPEMKQELMHYLKSELGVSKDKIIDAGTHGEASVDYPDYAQKVCEKVQENLDDHVGVLICGTGIGISIAANKHKHIRAALVQSEFEAQMSRQHNNANVVCFGARIIDIEKAKALLKVFLTTDFEGGRHQRRVDKIHSLSSC